MIVGTVTSQKYLRPVCVTHHIFHHADMPRYLTPSARCLKLNHNIHNGQQVNKLGGFTCCSPTRHQEGPAHQTSPVQCMLDTNCWAPAAKVSQTKVMKRETNTQHMSHALTSWEMQLGPVTCSLIAWDLVAEETTIVMCIRNHPHMDMSNEYCLSAYSCGTELIECMLLRKRWRKSAWVKRCPGAHEET